MNQRPFVIVDVFAEQKYQGNQLAVVLDAQGLSDEEMQLITKEMNYSETTFILSNRPRKGGWDARIFTPATEIPFAGHPTLGTAFVILTELLEAPSQEVRLNLKVGQILVTLASVEGQPDVLWMKQVEPRFGQILEAEPTAEALGLDLADVDQNLPIQDVSTGFPFFVVPLKSLEAVKRARLDPTKYWPLIEHTEAKDFLLFCRQTYKPENDLNVRVFVEYHGIPEDPATGSGNGDLAAYLVKHRVLGQDRIDVRVEQGYEIGRPSLLFLHAAEKNGRIEVQVGGQVILIARGELV